MQIYVHIFSHLHTLSGSPHSPIVLHPIPLPILASTLILTSSLLTRLELIQIPPTNRQVALVLIHTTLEVHHLRLAHLGRLIALVHRVLAVRLLSDGLVDRCLRSAAAAEEAAEGVADAGADRDAAA
jgi:hypothetical protein